MAIIISYGHFFVTSWIQQSGPVSDKSVLLEDGFKVHSEKASMALDTAVKLSSF